MSKKSLPGELTDGSTWREGDDDPAEGYPEGPVAKPAKAVQGKPSRQRIEEYFERKRLAEVLQEDPGEDFFKP